MGKFVCHRGRAAWSCATVNSITDPWNAYEAPSPRSYVWVTANGPGAQCAGGDSGGNVYSGGTAYGALSACYGTKSIFMAIRYINGDNMVVTYH